MSLKKSSRGLLVLLGFLFLIAIPFKILAQEEFQFAHFMRNKLFFNPAYAGSTRFMEINLLHRTQWQGVDGAPQHSLVSLQTPLNYSRVGLGLTVSNNKYGLENDNAIFLSYAFHLDIGDRSKLSMGLQAGITNKQVRWSEKIIHDANDPVFPDTDISALAPNFGLGFYYYSPVFYLGFSAPYLLTNSQPTSESFAENFNFDGKNIIFYLNSGFNLPISSQIDMEPSVLLKSSASSTAQLSAHVNFAHENGLTFGAGFHSESEWAVLLGYQITPKLGFSYGYGHSLAKTKAPGVSNHEFILNYNLSLRKNQITSPRYF